MPIKMVCCSPPNWPLSCRAACCVTLKESSIPSLGSSPGKDSSSSCSRRLGTPYPPLRSSRGQRHQSPHAPQCSARSQKQRHHPAQRGKNLLRSPSSKSLDRSPPHYRPHVAKRLSPCCRRPLTQTMSKSPTKNSYIRSEGACRYLAP